MIHWKNNLWLITIAEFEQLPDGFELISINGQKATKGKDHIDKDTRGYHLAYGIISPSTHPQSEDILFMRLAANNAKG